MTIRLGLDASQRIASCAVATEPGIVATSASGKPVENFTTLIRETLLQAHVSLEEINEIVVCVGPGSQMGVRTTVATGNALALALGVPISGVLSVDALAATVQEREPLRTAVSDGRGRWYVAEYNWNGDNLQRITGLQFVEDLPPDTILSCEPGCVDLDETRLCARGILLVADQQRHLVSQSLVEEIAPYERG